MKDKNWIIKKVKLLFDEMKEKVQKPKRGLRQFSNMGGLMDKGEI